MNASHPFESFLLLELCIAMVLISIGLVGLLDGFRAAFQAHRIAIARRTAILLLHAKEQEMERAATYRETEDRGGFDSHPGYSWETVVEPTDIGALFRLRLSVVGPAGEVDKVLYRSVALAGGGM